MQQYINNFLRYIGLFITIIVIATITAGIFIKPDGSYTVSAVLWAEQQVSFEPPPNNTVASDQSPSSNQLRFLQELLNSATFIQQVTDQLEQNGFKFDHSQLLSLQVKISKEFKLTSTGDHSISVEYKDIDPNLTMSVVQTVVKNFTDTLSNRIKNQGTVAINLLLKQVTAADDKLTKASEDLHKYIADHPEVVSAVNNTNGPTALTNTDLEYQVLNQAESDNRHNYETLNNQLQQLSISYDTYTSGKDTILKVYDAPRIVESLSYDSAARIRLGAILGFLVGIFATILMVLFFTWIDRSLYSTEYTRRKLGIPLVLNLSQNELLDRIKRANVTNQANRIDSYTYHRRKLNRLIALSLVGMGLGLGIGRLVAATPSVGVIVATVSLGVVIICRWPIVGYFLSILIVLPSELFVNPDGISDFTTKPLTNLNFYTNLPLSATPLELILVLTTAVSLVHIGLRRQKLNFINSRTTILTALLGGFIIYSYVYGVLIKHGDNKAAQWEVRALVYIVVLYFLTVYLMPLDKRYWKVLSWLLPLGISLMCAITIYRFIIFSDGSAGTMYSTESLNGFSHETALLFVMLIMWTGAKYIFGGTIIEKITGSVLLLPAFFCLFVSNRRAAFASLAISIVIILAMMFVRRRKAFIICVVILGIVVPPYTIIFRNASGPLGAGARAFASTSAEPGSRDYNSDLYRIVEKNNVLLTIKTAPLTGIGFGEPFNRYIDFIDLEGFTFQYYTAHVQVLWLWLKLGVFGWATFWLIVCTAFFKLGQIIKYNKLNNEMTMVVISGCIIATIMVYAYIDLALVNTRLMTLLGMSIGIIEVGYYTISRPAKTVVPVVRRDRGHLETKELVGV